MGETLAATFAVEGHDLVKAEVTVDAENVICDGTAKCPSVVVRLGGKTLTDGVDYDVSYEDNVAAGVAKAIEPLAYDWAWHGDAVTNTEMKILVPKGDAVYATTLVSGLKDEGVHDWQPGDKGQLQACRI